MSNPGLNEKIVQKPFRCSESLDVEINRAKGALMVKTGLRISDNKFMIQLIELGLKTLRQSSDLQHPEKSI